MSVTSSVHGFHARSLHLHLRDNTERENARSNFRVTKAIVNLTGERRKEIIGFRFFFFFGAVLTRSCGKYRFCNECSCELF